jgi:hypothetical protein
MDKKTVIWLLVGVVVGVVAAPKLSSLPVLNKLPQV